MIFYPWKYRSHGKPLPEILPGVLGDSAMENIKDIAKDFDVVLMGPGLGRNDETCQW